MGQQLQDKPRSCLLCCAPAQVPAIRRLPTLRHSTAWILQKAATCPMAAHVGWNQACRAHRPVTRPSLLQETPSHDEQGSVAAFQLGSALCGSMLPFSKSSASRCFAWASKLLALPTREASHDSCQCDTQQGVLCGVDRHQDEEHPQNCTSTSIPEFNTSRKPPAEVLMRRMCVMQGCGRSSRMLAWPGQVTAALSARRWL